MISSGRLIRSLVSGLLLVIPGSVNGQAFSEPFDQPAWRAFDFWIGDWQAELAVKVDSNRWVPWKTARVRVYPVLGGKAILELWDEETEDPSGLRGFSLRYFNPAESRWDLILHWPQPNQGRVPVFHGYATGNRFEFYNRYPVSDSVMQWVRFTFSDVTPTSLRWDDGYSRDGGTTWQENWRMHFTRLADQAAPPDPMAPPTWHTGQRCTDPVYSEIARWADVRVVIWDGIPFSARGFPILDGCASLVFLNPTEQRGDATLLLVSHDSASGGIHITSLAQDRKLAAMFTGTDGLIQQVSGPATYHVTFNGDQLLISD